MRRRIREGKKNQEKKKLMIKFMNNQLINPSINQSMELEVGKVRLVVVVLSASRCLFLFFKKKKLKSKK